MIIDVKSKDILSNLKSTDPEILLETITKIRDSGNSYILAELIDLLHNTELPEIKRSILNLLSELKNKESVPAFIEAIKNEKYINEHKELIACCWQNGLSYNKYLPVFIDLVINEEFLIAFEAFTVIENKPNPPIPQFPLNSKHDLKFPPPSPGSLSGFYGFWRNCRT